MRRLGVACLVWTCLCAWGCEGEGGAEPAYNNSDGGDDDSDASTVGDPDGSTGGDGGISADGSTDIDGSMDASTDRDGSADEEGGTDAQVDAEGDAGSEHLAEQVVGSAGGTLTLDNGVSIEIPAGALEGDETITVDELTDTAPPPGATPVGPTYQLGPPGLTFQMPVQLVLPYQGGPLPAVIAHLPSGGSEWTTLQDSWANDTHVRGYTDGFSRFRAVVYQGSPDTPIVLDNDEPVLSGFEAIPVGTSSFVGLRGTGFRTDTVITLFKDGVETATVSTVELRWYGLSFTVPEEFTSEVGLLTIQAQNPEATVSDAVGIQVIATPVLASLSPTSLTAMEVSNISGAIVVESTPVEVVASDLPSDFSPCRVVLSAPAGPGLAFGEEGTLLSHDDNGFSFSLDTVPVAATWAVGLRCGSAMSNTLSLEIEEITP